MKKLCLLLFTFIFTALSLTSILSTVSAIKYYSQSKNIKEINWDLWDNFIKYDLCITDYDALTDGHKELCQFIFETERSADDTIICERARRIVAGYDVGNRVTLEQTKHYYDIQDSAFIDKEGIYDYDNIVLRNVPDIKHLDFTENYNEYWLNDEGTEKILTNGENTSFAEHDYKEHYRYEKYDDNGTLIEYQNIPRIKQTADTIENNGCIFEIYPNNTLRLSEFIDSCEVVDIPEQINGMDIVGIKAYAFSETDVKEVLLPKSLKYIEPYAFDNCQNLTNINFPEKLESIGGLAFNNCDSLDKIFLNCPNLQIQSAPFIDAKVKDITINIKSVSSWFIKSFESIEKIKIGSDVKELGLWFLDGTYEIPETVKVINGENGNIPFASILISENIEIFGSYPKATGTIGTTGINSPANVPLLKHKCVLASDCIIYGYEDTEAERYADEFNLTFAIVGTEPVITTPVTTVATATTITTTTTISTTVATQSKPLGDSNGDGELNVRDCAFIASALANGTADDLTEISDFNSDGKINVRDAAAIARYLASK